MMDSLKLGLNSAVSIEKENLSRTSASPINKILSGGADRSSNASPTKGPNKKRQNNIINP